MPPPPKTPVRQSFPGALARKGRTVEDNIFDEVFKELEAIGNVGRTGSANHTGNANSLGFALRG